MEPPPPSPAGGKLRLMCSYGGHIVARPRSKSFCYAGGDTRIVAIDRRTITTLDLLVSHLSVTLSLNFSFTLKYQLPHLGLDSLISLTSDEDLKILIDEHDRLCSAPPSSATPSRIRVFLFPTAIPGSGQPVIRHPKTESWFFDALKSAKIVMQKGLGEAHGYGYEAHGFLPSGPESMVLETSSSFGSTSSSASLTNLPSLKAQSEDNAPTTTVPSDNSVPNIVPHHQNISYQDPVLHASTMETRANSTEAIKLESKVPNNTNLELVAYNTSFPHLDNHVQMQHVQFVQPFQHLIYHPNQPYPVYLVPFEQIPRNNFPTIVSSQASLNQKSSFMTSPFASGFPSQNYTAANSATSFVHIPQVYQQSQTVAVAVASKESPAYGNEHDGGDLDRVQIYKSQPPPP